MDAMVTLTAPAEGGAKRAHDNPRKCAKKFSGQSFVTKLSGQLLTNPRNGMGTGRGKVSVMNKHSSRIAIAGVSHHTANVMALESFRFPDEPAFLAAAKKRFSSVLLLQTCNRVEIIIEGDAHSLRDFLESQLRSDFFLLEGREALHHLFSLAAGIESMIVGEDQIIGQLKKAVADGEVPGPASPFLTLCINKAVHVGVGVRQNTRINRGAVSVGVRCRPARGS